MKKTFTYGTFYPPSPTGARPYAPVGSRDKQFESVDYARNHHASSYRSNYISHNPARLDLAS